jgi:hypothetical protein
MRLHYKAQPRVREISSDYSEQNAQVFMLKVVGTYDEHCVLKG